MAKSRTCEAGIRTRGLERKLEKTAYLFIALPILMFLVFRILPSLYSFYISVMKWNLLSSSSTIKFVGLDNYARVLGNDDFIQSMKNTAVYVLVSVPLMVLIGVIMGLMLNAIKCGKTFYRTLSFLPYVTTTVAVSFIWKMMFQESSGTVNALLHAVGIGSQPFLNSPSQAIFVVISNVVWIRIGFNSIMTMAGLSQIPRSYYEASAIDGATGWKQFWYITLPQLNPTLVYITMMGSITTLQLFTQIANITTNGSVEGGGPLKSTTTMVYEIYLEGFRKYRMGTASAMTVILFFIVLVFSLVQMKLMNRDTD